MTEKSQEHTTSDSAKNSLPVEGNQFPSESSSRKLSSGIKDAVGLLAGVLLIGANINGAINSPKQIFTSLEDISD
jgi:hypothetical protein